MATAAKNTYLAVISDAHGNLEALDRVLEDIDRRGVTDCVCLGDAVGYGPEPEACARRIRERGMPMILGNHEKGLADARYLDWFNPVVRKIVIKTRAMLDEETLDWLCSRPAVLLRDDMLFVHGCPPDSVDRYLFAMDEEEIAEAFRAYPQRLAFAGHTHELNLYSYDGSTARREPFREAPVRLEPGKRYLVNAGAVGQPRDEDKRAKYVLLNRETDVLRAVFVEYDAMKTVEAMRRLGMPEAYARRLL